MAIWTCLLGLFLFMTMYFSILSMLHILHHIMVQSTLIGCLGWWCHSLRRTKLPFSFDFLTGNTNGPEKYGREVPLSFKPRICNNTFAYSAICEWNDLPSNIKDIKGEKKFKDNFKKCILEEADNKENNIFIYY